MRRYSGGPVCGLVQGVAFGCVFLSCCWGCACIFELLHRRANGDLEMCCYSVVSVCLPVQGVMSGWISPLCCRGCADVFWLLRRLAYRNWKITAQP